ncbi:MAG: hypothetical protein AB1765_07230 [Candidatus Hydrogenedentota bacterium]
MVDNERDSETLIFKIIILTNIILAFLSLLTLLISKIAKLKIIAFLSGEIFGLILFGTLILISRIIISEYITKKKLYKLVLLLIIYLFKFLLVFGIVYILLIELRLSAIYFSSGFTLLLVSIVIGTLIYGFRLIIKIK